MSGILLVDVCNQKSSLFEDKEFDKLKGTIHQVFSNAKYNITVRDKSYEMKLRHTASAPLLTDRDVKNIADGLRENSIKFVDRVSKSVRTKKARYDKYVSLFAERGKLDFFYSFSVELSTKQDANKMRTLDKVLKTRGDYKEF